MPLLIIPCPHCTKPSKIDSGKLPDKTVFFSCPHCSNRVVVDKSKLLAQHKAPAAQAPAEPSIPDEFSLPAVEPTVPDRRFSKLPPDAILPSGIIVGCDQAVIDEIRQALAALGSEVEPLESPEAARRTIVNEQPHLCIYVAGEVGEAPHEPMVPLTGLPPSFRRRLFLLLVADDVNTSDGNAAFLHEVNMTLAREDVGQIGAALYSGLDYHERLYKTYLEVAENKGSIFF